MLKISVEVAQKIKDDFFRVKFQKRIKNKEIYLMTDYIPEWSAFGNFNRVDHIIMEHSNNTSSLISSLTYDEYMKRKESRRNIISLCSNGLIWLDNKQGENISIPLKMGDKQYLVYHTFNQLVIYDPSGRSDRDTLIINDDGTTTKLDDIYAPDSEYFELASNIYKNIGLFHDRFIRQ